MKKRIMIVAGEASGDLHGGNLIREVRAMAPDVSFFGVCGPRMRAAGAEALVDSSAMAVVGLVEIASHFGVIYRAWKTLTGILKTAPPDLLILIDYPDFNLLLANVAKKAGVPVLYYISPQVWAWRVGRVKKIARLVDHMAVVFPFEVPFYEKEDVPVTFVGHPLVDTVVPTVSREQGQQEFGLDPGWRTIGLFPGSRKGEIKYLLPVILETAQLLATRYPDLQFILPLASSLSREELVPYLDAADVAVTIVEGRSYDVMQVCDAIITVSGTVTLEIALVGVPMVIIYKVSPLTYAIGKRVVKVDHIGLCNIVAGERIVQELVQHDAEPLLIADEISHILDDQEYARLMREKLQQVKEKLGKSGGSANVARLVSCFVSPGK